MRGTKLHLVAGLCAAWATSVALAAPIEFEHLGSGSGTIDGVAFSATFAITAVGNTNDRQDLGFAFFIDHTSAEINIDGVGLFSFVSGTRTFVNNSAHSVGFSRAGFGGADLFNGPTNAAFGSWDMLSSIGPISGGGELLQWGIEDVVTSGGILFFDDFFTDVRFTATVVPAPASLTLLSITGIALTRRRR